MIFTMKQFEDLLEIVVKESPFHTTIKYMCKLTVWKWILVWALRVQMHFYAPMKISESLTALTPSD